MLIGLCGVPGAGKSTVAKYLAEVHEFDHINVGDAIKVMMAGFYYLCGLTDHEVDRRLIGDLKETPDALLNGKSPRYAMQTLGKEWRDLISPSLFADRWRDRLSASKKGVADGMRYPEEVPVLRSLGGVMVKVVRPGFDVEPNAHIAERQELPYDYLLENSGTEDELEDAVDLLLEKLSKASAAA